MIIVYTNKGSICINDDAVLSVEFERKRKEVSIIAKNDPTMRSAREIYHVQQVVYNVQAEPRAINDSCQEILDLRNAIHEQAKKYNSLEKSHAILRAYNRKLYDNDPALYDKLYEEIHKEFKEYFDEQANESKPGD